MTELHVHREEIWLDAACAHGLAEHLFLHLPHEACGVLRGNAAAGGMRIETFFPIRNVAPDPLHRFTLNPQEWVQECLNPSGLLGIFHTHPHSAPVPSAEDLRQLPLFGDLLRIYLISSPDESGSSIVTHAYFIDRSPAGEFALRPARLCMT
ncbi:M67 family metallopeptidase [Paenibacillus sp. XY044]|uniref:M67 family metallopeptidase n=1 Tax=Paenibacillus sp. XY044 TaxID=2026089 RepID=UPI0015C631A9|nr:M67 family metallopeptidase [Paenibacillus sp. XY044]